MFQIGQKLEYIGYTTELLKNSKVYEVADIIYPRLGIGIRHDNVKVRPNKSESRIVYHLPYVTNEVTGKIERMNWRIWLSLEEIERREQENRQEMEKRLEIISSKRLKDKLYDQTRRVRR